ncbi:hypothetical protein BMS3Bbin02_01574 [bacterium BMS3Bbin02]|nr:hypothetical protein BMS3Bbin02_01574 [bacterium BMS3Bbin02]
MFAQQISEPEYRRQWRTQLVADGRHERHPCVKRLAHLLLVSDSGDAYRRL